MRCLLAQSTHTQSLFCKHSCEIHYQISPRNPRHKNLKICYQTCAIKNLLQNLLLRFVLKICHLNFAVKNCYEIRLCKSIIRVFDFKQILFIAILEFPSPKVNQPQTKQAKTTHQKRQKSTQILPKITKIKIHTFCKYPYLCLFE